MGYAHGAPRRGRHRAQGNREYARREETAAVKLPHITVEYREEENYALDRVSITLILGMAAHITWMYLFMFNGPKLFFPDLHEAGGFFFSSSLITFGITLLCYGIFLKQARKLFSTPEKRNRNRSLAAIMVFASMVLMFAANAGFAPYALSLVCGVISGIGSAVLLMSYGVSFSVCDLPAITVGTSFAIFISVIAFVLVGMLANVVPAIGIVVALCMPAVEWACLKRCSQKLVDRLEFNDLTTPVKTAPFALHVCLPSIAFGIILGITRARVAHLPQDPSEFSDVVTFSLMAAVLALVVMLASVVFQRRNNNFTFRTLMPVSALLLALLVIPAYNQSPYATFSLFAAYIMMEGCMWIFYADISQTYRISAFTVFGFGRGSLALGAFISFALDMCSIPVCDTLGNSAAFVAFAFILFSFGRSLLPTNLELRETLKRGRQCPALISDDEYARREVIRQRNQIARAVEAIAEESNPTPEGASVAMQAPVQAPGAKTTPQEEASGAQKLGLFKRKCALVAETYLLSRKETEVLFLLAKGLNSAAIQEKLYISAGTANTHMRHIYRKLDVHSQQELMTLVKSTWVEE